MVLASCGRHLRIKLPAFIKLSTVKTINCQTVNSQNCQLSKIAMNYKALFSYKFLNTNNFEKVLYQVKHYIHIFKIQFFKKIVSPCICLPIRIRTLINFGNKFEL